MLNSYEEDLVVRDLESQRGPEPTVGEIIGRSPMIATVPESVLKESPPCALLGACCWDANNGYCQKVSDDKHLDVFRFTPAQQMQHKYGTVPSKDGDQSPKRSDVTTDRKNLLPKEYKQWKDVFEKEASE